MTFTTEVFSAERYTHEVASIIRDLLPLQGSVVLTGGTTAQRIYPQLARLPADWSGVEVLFSDERCVPPDHASSNFKMAHELLLGPVGASKVHRMRGEAPPEEAAHRYDREIASLVEPGLDLVLLGMGADAHIGAMFPSSPALGETRQLSRAVDRPDGMQGLTLTPPALTTAKKVVLLVTGRNKAETVARAINGTEPVHDCPARLLADHPDATFLLDDAAATAL